MGNPNTKAAKKPKSAETKAGGPTHAPDQIPPSSIRPNPRNPRKKFPEKRIAALAESLDEVGMLVPLTVYREPAETEFVLLDGERRLRAAISNNMPLVPAWVTPRPEDEVQNTLRMFNIHLMRDEWGEMATAYALKEVMERTGKTSETDLRRITGLTVDRIRNMKRVLSFPEEWQQRVLNEEVPFNLLVELDKAILSKKKNAKTSGLIDLNEEALRDFFLGKYDEGVVTDVVDLRKVGTLIDTAGSTAHGEKVRKRAKQALDELLKSEKSIEDAYQFGAAASVEIKIILRDLDMLPGRLSDVAATEMEDDDRQRLLLAVSTLRDSLDDVIARLKNDASA